jgi:hypothetical protein
MNGFYRTRWYMIACIMVYRYGVLIVPVAEVNQSVANSATCTGKKTDVIQNSSIGDPRQQMLLHRRVLIISNCRKGAHTHEGRQLVYSRCISAKVDDFHCRLKKILAIRSADCEIESHKLAQGVPKVFHLVYYPDDWHRDHP